MQMFKVIANIGRIRVKWLKENVNVIVRCIIISTISFWEVLLNGGFQLEDWQNFCWH